MPERTGKQEGCNRRESNRNAGWRDGKETNENDDLMLCPIEDTGLPPIYLMISVLFHCRVQNLPPCTHSQNQSCQTGVRPAGKGGSSANSTRASPGAWKSVPREARKP